MNLWLAAQALLLRFGLPWMLRGWPLDRVLQWLTPARPRGPQDGHVTARVERVTDLLTRRFPPTRTACLKRALMRYALLRRAGLSPRFVIGVRPGGADGFEAHAWLVLDGAPVMEKEPLVTFRPAFVWPAQP